MWYYENMNTTNKQYVPGVCNIGPVEIAMRKRFGWISLAVTIITAILFYFLALPSPWYLLLFFPASASASGLIQGYTHFCAAFGMKGLFNFGSELGKTESVDLAAFRKQDQMKAIVIIASSILSGVIVALAGFYLSKYFIFS